MSHSVRVRDLVVQGPDATEESALALRKLSGAQDCVALAPHAFRLHDVRPQPAVARYCAARRIDHGYVAADARLSEFAVLAMDMDSTLITVECIDEIADMAGVKPAVSAVTEAAMRGEIDFAESLRRRVALLAGLPVTALEQVYEERVQLSPGAETLLARARERGLRTLLVSGGFDLYVDRLRARLGIDYARSNRFEVHDGKLTGKVEGTIFDAHGKAAALRDVCAGLDVPTARALVIGDGANDLPMMRTAGVSIAYRAKPLVRMRATHALDHSGLDGVLHLYP